MGFCPRPARENGFSSNLLLDFRLIHLLSLYREVHNSNSLLKVLGILGFLPKPQKTASNKLAKLLGNFVSLEKFPLHLANMPSPPSFGITCIPICQLVLPTCWRLHFVILAKILGCQVLLPSPNSKLLEKASFFTWHLVLGFGKTIDLPSEF